MLVLSTASLGLVTPCQQLPPRWHGMAAACDAVDSVAIIASEGFGPCGCNKEERMKASTDRFLETAGLGVQTCPFYHFDFVGVVRRCSHERIPQT